MSKIVPTAYWLQTFGEGVYNLISSELSTRLTPRVIAHHLSQIPRFGGASRFQWTVAEHTLLVKDIGLQLLRTTNEHIYASPYLLLHDAHEMITGDIPAPVKKYLKDYHAVDIKKILEEPIDRRVRQDLHLSLEPDPWVLDLVSEADAIALKLEREAFMASKHEWIIDELQIPAGLTVKFNAISNRASLAKLFRTELSNSLEKFAHVFPAVKASSETKAKK